MSNAKTGGFVINFQEITLEQKAVFDRHFKERRYENAHHNFTNLFMWRNLFNIKWALNGNHLCIQSSSEEGKVFMLQPFGPDQGLEDTLEAMADYCRSLGAQLVMRGVEKFMLDIIEKWRPGYFDYIPDTDSYDYLYSRQDLVELKGRKYHGKKNHINKFHRTYPNYEYLPLTGRWIDKCIANTEEWYLNKDDSQDIMLRTEKEAILEVLNNFSNLNLTGGVIAINDRVEAFTFGEALNSDTAVIHVEKANPDLSGVYSAINRDFCLNAWPDMTYINREEDMGLEGLRKAKESYYPVKMIEKFIVVAKKNNS